MERLLLFILLRRRKETSSHFKCFPSSPPKKSDLEKSLVPAHPYSQLGHTDHTLVPQSLASTILTDFILLPLSSRRSRPHLHTKHKKSHRTLSGLYRILYRRALFFESHKKDKEG